MRGGARARGGAAAPRAAPAATSAPPKPSCVDTVLAGLDRRATAGQLIVVGAPLGGAVGPSVDLVKKLPVGGVLLTGRSRAGVAAVAARTAALQQAVTGRAGLIVAADQEGGAGAGAHRARLLRHPHGRRAGPVERARSSPTPRAPGAAS